MPSDGSGGEARLAGLEKLWEVGSYHNLDKNRSKLEMPAYNKNLKQCEWARLKAAGLAVAQWVDVPGKFGPGRTVVHGDIKPADMLFAQQVAGGDAYRCALIDFQFTGGSYGSRDLAMLVCCAVDYPEQSVVEGKRTERAVLDRYHKVLVERLRHHSPDREDWATYPMGYGC